MDLYIKTILFLALSRLVSWKFHWIQWISNESQVLWRIIKVLNGRYDLSMLFSLACRKCFSPRLRAARSWKGDKIISSVITSFLVHHRAEKQGEARRGKASLMQHRADVLRDNAMRKTRSFRSDKERGSDRPGRGDRPTQWVCRCTHGTVRSEHELPRFWRYRLRMIYEALSRGTDVIGDSASRERVITPRHIERSVRIAGSATISKRLRIDRRPSRHETQLVPLLIKSNGDKQFELIDRRECTSHKENCKL